MADLTGARWRKSTRSGDNGGICVEVADNLPGVVAVRYSKDRTGPVLTFTPDAWGGLSVRCSSGGSASEVTWRAVASRPAITHRLADICWKADAWPG